MPMFVDNGGSTLVCCLGSEVKAKRYGSNRLQKVAKQPHKYVIQNVIFWYNNNKSKIKVNQSLTDKCSVKHGIKLEVSQFDVPPFAGENRDIQAVRKTLWDLQHFCVV